MSLINLDKGPHTSNLNGVFCLPGEIPKWERVGGEGTVMKMGTVEKERWEEISTARRTESNKSVTGDSESSSGCPHLMVLPRERVTWQTVCAAVKHHQHSHSLWKQELWLFIYPNPTGLFTHCWTKQSRVLCIKRNLLNHWILSKPVSY